MWNCWSHSTRFGTRCRHCASGAGDEQGRATHSAATICCAARPRAKIVRGVPRMKAIDSLLNILLQQGGTELRLVSERRPQMFKGDKELPLTIPATSTERIRDLLDDFWTAHETDLRARGGLSVSYRSPELGTFAVRLAQPSPAQVEVYFTPSGSEPRLPAEDAHDALAGDARGPQAVPTSAALPSALSELLARAATRGASDIHLSPRRPPIVRVNGVLEELTGE